MILRFRCNFRLRRGGETAIPDKFQPEASQSGIRDVAVRGLQPRKLLRLCLAGLRVGWFDPIAEASELPNYSGSALLLGLFGVYGELLFDQSRVRRHDGQARMFIHVF